MSQRPSSQDATQQPPAFATAAPETALDEALAEIERLRREVQRLRQALNDPLADAVDAQGEAAPPALDGAHAGETGGGVARRPEEGATPAPRSEEDALARLERLRQSIARARAGREQAAADFRDLVKPARESGRAHEPATPATVATVVAPVGSGFSRTDPPESAAAPADVAAVGSGFSRTDQPATDTEPALKGSAVVGSAIVGSGFGRTDTPLGRPDTPDTPPAALFESLPTPRRWPWLLLLVALAFVAGGLLYWLSLPQAPPPVVSGESARPAGGDAAATPDAPAGATQTAPPSPPGTASAAASPGAAAVDESALRVELRTTRDAWIRVVVDGRRSLERLVRSGEVLTFSATTLVSVRAGDAGAVLVSVNGEPPAPLGGDGQIATQSFAAPDTPGLKPDDVR